VAATSNRSGAIREAVIRKDEQIADALVISLTMTVRNELTNGGSKRHSFRNNSSWLTEPVT
jgi:hypothetical protein